MFCNARTRKGGRCRRYPLAGKRRCLLHGGKSTGPRTLEGMSRTLSAMWWGRKRMVERRHALGLKAPGGRPSARWPSPKDRDSAYILNDLLSRLRTDR